MTVSRTQGFPVMDRFHDRAAPAGGAWKQGRGCGFILACLMAAPANADDVLDVPSGQPLHFQEMLWDRPAGGLVYRFRFVAPELGAEGRAFDEVALDMEVLCQNYALPRLAAIGPKPSQIVISLASEATEFGEATPEVVQYFEAYSIEDGRCIWEMF